MHFVRPMGLIALVFFSVASLTGRLDRLSAAEPQLLSDELLAEGREAEAAKALAELLDVLERQGALLAREVLE